MMGALLRLLMSFVPDDRFSREHEKTCREDDQWFTNHSVMRTGETASHS